MAIELDIPIVPVIACDVTVFEEGERERHFSLAEELFRQKLAVEELPAGYAFQLPNDTNTFLATAQFVARERQCCNFFNFNLELSADKGAFWLHITGPDGVKSFMREQFGV